MKEMLRNKKILISMIAAIIVFGSGLVVIASNNQKQTQIEDQSNYVETVYAEFKESETREEKVAALTTLISDYEEYLSGEKQYEEVISMYEENISEMKAELISYYDQVISENQFEDINAVTDKDQITTAKNNLVALSELIETEKEILLTEEQYNEYMKTINDMIASYDQRLAKIDEEAEEATKNTYNQAYIQIIEDAMNAYGIHESGLDEGVIYVDLVDFEGDQESELLLIYRSEEEGVVIEVWQGENKLWSEVEVGSGCSARDVLEVSLAYANGKYFLMGVRDSAVEQEWEYSMSYAFGTVVDDTFVVEKTSKYSEYMSQDDELAIASENGDESYKAGGANNPYTITVNGEPATDEEHQEMVNKYTPEKSTVLLEANGGTCVPVIDTTDNYKNIDALLTELEEGI